MNGDVEAGLARHRLVPVIVIDDDTNAAQLGEALRAGGLPIAEVTFRTPAAVSAIRVLAEDRSLLVGAGTVLDVGQVEAAAEAGACFIVSPGFDADVVRRSRELGIFAIPGVATATELQTARRAGVEIMKFFPAGPLGGPSALRALAAAFPDVRFVPTGGIGPDNLADYLELPMVVAVGGSFMVPSTLLAAGDWAGVEQRVRDAVELAAAPGRQENGP